jgi:hypothetical protein
MSANAFSTTIMRLVSRGWQYRRGLSGRPLPPGRTFGIDPSCRRFRHLQRRRHRITAMKTLDPSRMIAPCRSGRRQKKSALGFTSNVHARAVRFEEDDS